MSSNDQLAKGVPRSSFFQLLGVRIAAVEISDTVSRIEVWLRERQGCHFIAVTGMHGMTEAQRDPRFKEVLRSAQLVVPDGMPLVWIGRLRGHNIQRRVYGPELMLTFFQVTAGRGYRHFLYGGAPGIPERLAESLKERFEGTDIVGTYSPPFRPLTLEEDSRVVEMINRVAPDVVWVGLSTPKQERWMYAHRSLLNAPVLIGVGAAFDINAGMKKQAPRWIREHGFEWLFRLLQEPRRLWHRYLVYGSQFIFYVALELLGIRKSK